MIVIDSIFSQKFKWIMHDDEDGVTGDLKMS